MDKFGALAIISTAKIISGAKTNHYRIDICMMGCRYDSDGHRLYHAKCQSWLHLWKLITFVMQLSFGLPFSFTTVILWQQTPWYRTVWQLVCWLCFHSKMCMK